MEKMLLYLMLLSGVFHFVKGQPAHQPGKVQRGVAVTIDDLPVVSLFRDRESKQEITQKLLATLTAYEVPAIGFVNENKLYTDERLDTGEVALLEQWLKAGLELGNHAYAHKDYHHVEFDEFAQDIKKGEPVTRNLLAGYDKSLRYFRHPYLHVGNSPEKKVQLENFLKGNGYQVAPVTIDNQEWIFARAYDNALLSGDSALARRIGKTYVDYMEDVFAYYEQQSVGLFDREIRQVLLLHANTINADYLDDLLVMMQERNYRFIPLEEALQDEAYTSEDTYTGNGGISWIHRWAFTQGRQGSFFKGEPEAPAFVHEVAALK